MRISRALARMRAALTELELDRESASGPELALPPSAPAAAMPRAATPVLRTRAAAALPPIFPALRDDLPSALQDRLTALAASLG
jgi:hypothetical protein